MIHQAEKSDAPAVAELAALLWPGHAQECLCREFEELLAGDSGAVFLSWAGGRPVGFAQCQLRQDYVEGTSGGPVGYLEGIFVREEYRHCGHARALLAACEQWAKEKGCAQFASDCTLENENSLAFHLKTGFAEVNRIICFVKQL